MDRTALYKYRNFKNPFHLSILTERKLHFAAPTSLNDPLDCQNPLRFDRGTPKRNLRLFSDLTAERHPELSLEEAEEVARKYLAEVDVYDSSNIDVMNRISNAYLDSAVGVCSLSRDPNVPDLWEEYSLDHTGFCVRFDWDRLTEWGNRLRAEGIRFGPIPVEYVDELPLIDVHALTPGEALARQTTLKTRQWEKENEYRLLGFGLSNQQLILDEGIITGVSLGACISRENRAEIIRVVKGFPYRIDLLQAVKNYTPAGALVIRHRPIDY